uniref:Uncharacterized protein n=1 Tax=Triticum urartu TaxID=4572 RepID=A0A8R7R8X1_TRIUA
QPRSLASLRSTPMTYNGQSGLGVVERVAEKDADVEILMCKCGLMIRATCSFCSVYMYLIY